MKKVVVIVVVALLMLLCGCPEIASSVPIVTNSTDNEPNTFQTKPTEQNCYFGHTVNDDLDVCTVCGMDYYSATLEFKRESTGYKLTGLGTCTRAVVIVPEIYNGMPVKTVCQLIPKGEINKTVTEIVLPSSISRIEDAAFARLQSLKKINIPEGITMLPESTFAGCLALEGVALPQSLNAIGKYAFAQCESIVEVKIPENVAVIGESAFTRCSKLQEVQLIDGTTCVERIIHESAFEHCNSLNNVLLGEQIVSIGDSAFANCTALISIILPDSLKEMGKNVFMGCIFMKIIVIGSGLHTITEGMISYAPNAVLFFHGTEQAWENIADGMNCTADELYFYSETQPTEPGHYWHYVDGVPTPWETEE